MNLLNYDVDILLSVFNMIEDTLLIFNFRVINKLCNEIFMKYFHSIESNIIPRSSFTNMRICGSCYSSNKNTLNNNNNSIYNDYKQLVYRFGPLPHKCIIHCRKKECYLASIKKYLIDIQLNNIYPFCEITDQFILDNYFIRKYFIENIRKWENRWYIECEDIYSLRFYRINNLHNLINHNLFWWFLNRKKELIQ